MGDTGELQAFPFPVADPRHPAAEYAERRARCPFGMVRLQSGHDARLLASYRDAVAAASDPRLSQDLTAPGSARPVAGPSFYDDPTSLLNMEGEPHRRIRRIVAPAFTPKAIAKWQPIVDRVATELLDEMAQLPRPVDLMAAYFFPLPVRVICTVLGVPDKDAERFRAWSNAFMSAAEMSIERQFALIGEFFAYATELVAAKREDPGADLIDELIAARDGDDRLTESELLSLIVGLIAAGNETTSNSLGRYVVTLLGEDRTVWDRLVADPELIPAAVDELLRLTPVGMSILLKVATEDVALPSGVVAAGEAVLVPTAPAMRDESVFPNADQVVLDREKRPNLAFGGGAHLCLGINLALVELRTALRMLTSRFPGLRIAVPVETLPYSNGDILNSLLSLPVDW
ncbi:MAG: cytochrome P450 [Mycobacteriaceae bacterium]|nr:cytochrome P450 [Mycobacteriaceae bacterium]